MNKIEAYKSHVQVKVNRVFAVQLTVISIFDHKVLISEWCRIDQFLVVSKENSKRGLGRWVPATKADVDHDGSDHYYHDEVAFYETFNSHKSLYTHYLAPTL